MSMYFVLIIIAALTAITFISLFLYRKLYENKINQVLESDTPKKVLSPIKVFLALLIILAVSIALFWKVFFPDYIIRDIDQSYSDSTLFAVYNDVLEVHELDDNQVFFTAGDFLQLRFDENLNLGDNTHNQVSFDIEGIHNRIQYVIYGNDQEVLIPTDTREMNWTVDELYSPQIRYRTLLQVLAFVDLEYAIDSVGELDQDGYYYLRIEGEFVTDFNYIEYLMGENEQLYEIYEDGTMSQFTENSYNEDSTYIAISFVRFGKDSENESSATYSGKESVTYYFDITDYILD